MNVYVNIYTAPDPSSGGERWRHLTIEQVPGVTRATAKAVADEIAQHVARTYTDLVVCGECLVPAATEVHNFMCSLDDAGNGAGELIVAFACTAHRDAIRAIINERVDLLCNKLHVRITRCGSCGTALTPPVRQCSACHRVAYCSAACQRAHWTTGGHKTECKRV
jgi:hypothetical protein